jgi:3D (Asp-Asp-Asp) domain-containing protein
MFQCILSLLSGDPESAVFAKSALSRDAPVFGALIIATITAALLVVPATFAGEQSLLARVTVYWASGGAGCNHQCATGLRLQTGDCSVDTRHIPYGSRLIFPDGTTLTAVDTGPAVRNRKAARISGRTVCERNAVVIDQFFETKREALSWASRNPPFLMRAASSNSELA